ncbi:MAG: cytochrome c family protein [Rhodospirillales bacterium]|nr:cytochrome c family protein [Rhodospirillales bacterium]
MKALHEVAIAVIMLVTSTVTSLAQQAGNAENGAEVFKRCRACHMVGEGARNLVGPVQNGLIGRQAGTYEGYAYSPLNKAAGDNGLIWTEENIFAYLADPNAFLKKFLTDKGKADLAVGMTKMPFRLIDEQERRDVIAYLKTLPGK